MPPSIIRVRHSKSFPYTVKKAFATALALVAPKITTLLVNITGKTSEL